MNTLRLRRCCLNSHADSGLARASACSGGFVSTLWWDWAQVLVITGHHRSWLTCDVPGMPGYNMLVELAGCIASHGWMGVGMPPKYGAFTHAGPTFDRQ